MNWRHLNPLHSLAGRIFLWFWLVLAITVTLTWLVSRQLLEDTEIRRLPPVVINQLNQQLQPLRQSQSTAQLLQQLANMKDSRWLVVQTQDNQILTPGLLPRQFNQNWLIELNQLNRPRLLRHNNIHLAGPFMLNSEQQQLALYQLRQRPPQPWWRLHHLSEPILILLLLCISAMASFVLAISISRPLKELLQKHLDFASGKMESRVARLAHRPDELGQLGRSFNTLAEQISALLENQQRLMRDISHELRSPLARAQLALALSERQQDMQQLPRIKRELESLEHMLDELLTFSKLDAGQYQFDTHPLDFVALTEDVISINQLEADVKEQTLSLDAPRQLWLAGDSRLLGRAIENIIRNAIKYSPSCSTISCTITAADQQAHLTIRDQGPGIPIEQLQHIFLPFYRVSHSRDNQTGGTGLGLAIVAQIIRQHRGQVSATLVAGGGLQINVTLPLTLTSPQDSLHDKTLC